MKTYIIFSILLGLSIIGVVLFSQSEKERNNQDTEGKLQVSASFYPMYFFASFIGGDKAKVSTITPFGVEPHDYEPTPQDIARMLKSNLIVLNGGMIEPWSSKITNDAHNNNTIIVVAGATGISGVMRNDPHVWLDPLLAIEETKGIEQGFQKADPSNAQYYAENASRLESKLQALHEEFMQGLAACKQRDFVTSHAAFAHMAERYNLNQVAISGISPDEEPSAKQLAKVADFVKEKGITYIFFEHLISPKLSQTIATETGAQTLVLDPIEGLSQDAFLRGDDYITVMRQNLHNLQIALQCNQ